MLTPAIRHSRLATDHFELTGTGAVASGDNELCFPFAALVLCQEQRLDEAHSLDASRYSDRLQGHSGIADAGNDGGLIDPMVSKPGLPPEAQALGMNTLSG